MLIEQLEMQQKILKRMEKNLVGKENAFLKDSNDLL